MGEWGRWGRANPSDRAITALLNSAQRHVWPLNHLHHLENRTACSYDHNAWPVRALVTLNHLHHVTSYTRGRSRPACRTEFSRTSLPPHLTVPRTRRHRHGRDRDRHGRLWPLVEAPDWCTCPGTASR